MRWWLGIITISTGHSGGPTPSREFRRFKIEVPPTVAGIVREGVGPAPPDSFQWATERCDDIAAGARSILTAQKPLLRPVATDVHHDKRSVTRCRCGPEAEDDRAPLPGLATRSSRRSSFALFK